MQVLAVVFGAAGGSSARKSCYLDHERAEDNTIDYPKNFIRYLQCLLCLPLMASPFGEDLNCSRAYKIRHDDDG